MVHRWNGVHHLLWLTFTMFGQKAEIVISTELYTQTEEKVNNVTDHTRDNGRFINF